MNEHSRTQGATHERHGEFRIGFILGTAAGVFARNFLRLLTLTVLLSLPLAVAVVLDGEVETTIEVMNTIVADGGQTTDSSVHTSYNLGWFSVVLGFVIFTLISGGLTVITLQDLRGRSIGLLGALRRQVPVIVPLLGASAVVSMAIWIGSFLLLVPGIIAYCVLFVALPVVVAERAGVFAALSRSAALTSGHRWRIFALGIVNTIVASVLGLIVVIVLAFVLLASPIVAAICLALYYVIYLTWGSVVAAVAYHELRVGKDGLASEDIAAVFD